MTDKKILQLLAVMQMTRKEMFLIRLKFPNDESFILKPFSPFWAAYEQKHVTYL